MSLETIRKNGQTIATPVWFVEEGGKLFVWTQAETGKIKRIRNTAAVRIAPCGQRGAIKGEWVAATAGVIDDPAQVRHISGLLRQKYGLAKRLFELVGSFRKRAYAGIEITPL